MSLSGSGNGRAPKRPGAGKPIKGYPKVSGADDETIDVRKIQKPPEESPPSQEPANALPTDSVEPAQADTAQPKPAVPRQETSEIDDGAGPLPAPPAVPESGESYRGSEQPQTVDEHRPSNPRRPDRPDWMGIPEAHTPAFGSEKSLSPAEEVAGQMQPRADGQTGRSDIGEMDETGSTNAQADGSQERTFLSIGERKEPFAPSGESRRRISGSRSSPIAESGVDRFGDERREVGAARDGTKQSPPIGNEGTPRVENRGSEAATTVQLPQETASAPIVPDAAFPLKMRRGEVEPSPASDTWGVLAVPPAPALSPPVEFGWGELGRGDFGKRIKDRTEQAGTILQTKHGIVTVRADTGRTFAVRQEGVRLVDDLGNNLRKPIGAPAWVNPTIGRKWKRNQPLVGKSADLVPNDGEPGVDLHGFKITKNFDDYLKLIEQITRTQWHSEQLDGLLAIADAESFLRLDSKALHDHSSAFTPEVKNSLVSEWEDRTGREWPRYEANIPDGKGGILRKEGDLYDAHHIIPRSYGGPHRWENLTPARCPNEHQLGIHRAQITMLLFP